VDQNLPFRSQVLFFSTTNPLKKDKFDPTLKKSQVGPKKPGLADFP
jgi:hypothetical protein